LWRNLRGVALRNSNRRVRSHHHSYQIAALARCARRSLTRTTETQSISIPRSMDRPST
jgi:hypothetical protein